MKKNKMTVQDWQELKFYVKQIRGYVVRMENFIKKHKQDTAKAIK